MERQNYINMKKIMILLVLPVFLGFKTGQEIDEKKMNRDLEIAKNILATLIKTGSNSFFSGESIDATYIKDFGVVFTIPEHLVYFHTGGRSLITIPEPPVPDVDVHFDYNYEGDPAKFQEDRERIQQEMKKAQKEAIKAQKEMEKAKQEAIIAMAEEKELNEVYIGNKQNSDIDWQEIMITFLADYSDLISQLKPDEKIVINQKSPFDELVVVWSGVNPDDETQQKGSKSAEVLRKDVTAYKSGKINREQFVDRVKIKKAEPSKKIADLEMFANIFDRYYSDDLTETFYSQGKPRYEVLDGYGVVFHIKASSGRGSYARVRFYRPGDTWTVEPKEKPESNDEELYPKFKEDVKSFMLDYGRTIRSLNDNETVLLDIKIDACRDCNVPESMEVSTKMSVLKQYDQQKISREKAMDQIEIKESF